MRDLHNVGSRLLLTISGASFTFFRFWLQCHGAKKVLLSLDLEQIYETDHSIMIDSQQYLREYVCRELGSPGKFTTAYWFHGTRTSADNTFDNGLLPLNKTESLVMDMLVNLAPDAVVKETLQAWNFHAGVPDTLFRMRTRNEMHWGHTDTLYMRFIFMPANSGSTIICGYLSW